MAITTELNLARNMFGALSTDTRRRILHYLNRPTEKGWTDIHGIIINWNSECETIWQAVIAVDLTFPRTGRVTDQHGRVVEHWTRIPEPALLEKAIVFATH